MSRRRQIFGQQTLAEKPMDEVRPSNKPVQKGCCPKCGKHIGRGVAFHVKACDGD